MLGSNGAGKTTLLRILAGSLRADQGQAVFEGRPIGSGNWRRRAVTAGLGHRGGAFGQALVAENLDFYSRLGPAGSRPAIGQLVELFGLNELLSRKVSTLSRGQRQRLELALTFARGPRLVLLDEPFAGLDAEGAGALQHYLESMSGRQTVLLATHDPQSTWAIADSVVVLNRGQVVLGCPLVDSSPAAALAASTRLTPPPERSGSDRQGPDQLSLGRIGDLYALSRMELVQLWRSPGSLAAQAALAILIMLCLSLALPNRLAGSADAAIGSFWASLCFAAILGAQDGFPRLRDSGTLTLLLTQPIARPALIMAQLAGQLARLLPVALVCLVAASLFFNANLLEPPMLVLAVSGSAALAALATAYGSLLSMTDRREVLGPLLMLPAALPIVLVGVLSTSSAIGQTYLGPSLQTAGLGLAYAGLIAAVAILAIEDVLDD